MKDSVDDADHVGDPEPAAAGVLHGLPDVRLVLALRRNPSHRHGVRAVGSQPLIERYRTVLEQRVVCQECGDARQRQGTLGGREGNSRAGAALLELAGAEWKQIDDEALGANGCSGGLPGKLFEAASLLFGFQASPPAPLGLLPPFRAAPPLLPDPL